MVVEDLRLDIAKLPGRDGVLHPLIERDEGVERGIGLIDAPRRLLGCAQALRPSGT